MRIIFIRLLPILFLVLFSLSYARPAIAHGDNPRLEISVEKINPGGVIEVRGVDFEYEELVSLSLTSSEIQIQLNEVTTDMEGGFTQIVVLPSDLAAGEYNFQAKLSDDHVVISPTIVVWGVASDNEESTGVWDQSDLALGPVPTLAAAAPTPQINSVPEPKTEPAKSSAVPYIWIAVALGITWIIVLVLRLRR
jgi:hypothetical protein